MYESTRFTSTTAMPSPYQRIIVKGIPCWKHTNGNLYYYESSTPPTDEARIEIGTEAGGLYPDSVGNLQPILSTYRAAQKSRARAPKN